MISSVRADIASQDEALNVAKNWISLIIDKKGSWGSSETAEIESIQEFKRGGKVLGYFCKVKPNGYIIISLNKELAPVKAYSATSDLNPECDEGMADFIKGGMERVLIAVEKQVGPIRAASSQEIQNVLEINYRDAWDELNVDTQTFKKESKPISIQMDYQEGDYLLNTS